MLDDVAKHTPKCLVVLALLFLSLSLNGCEGEPTDPSSASQAGPNVGRFSIILVDLAGERPSH